MIQLKVIAITIAEIFGGSIFFLTAELRMLMDDGSQEEVVGNRSSLFAWA
jgi:hypothetical protein